MSLNFWRFLSEIPFVIDRLSFFGQIFGISCVAQTLSTNSYYKAKVLLKVEVPNVQILIIGSVLRQSETVAAVGSVPVFLAAFLLPT